MMVDRCGQNPRVFVDCTQTVAVNRLSGIPRVVCNIVRHGAAAAARHGATLVPVHFKDGFFYKLDTSPVGDIIRPGGPSPSAMQRFAGRVAEHRVYRRLHKTLVPRTLVRGVRAGWHRVCPPTPIPDRVVTPEPGDVLLLADSSWNVPFWPAIDEARRRGTRLGIVQYDFIPDTHPELVPPTLPKVFRRWLKETLERADFVAAISQTVALEAVSRLQHPERLREGGQPVVGAFRLGSDVRVAKKGASPRPALAAFMAAAPRSPYLTVGTVEPRKNQSMLLDAFEEVWRREPEARLLVAGFMGWKGEETVRRLQSHPRWQTHVLHFGDLSDDELLYAYERARGLIFPSKAEGYGLPIVEALAHGMRVMASDIAVHREVGGSWCDYFPAGDPKALAACIIAAEQNEAAQPMKPSECFVPPAWDDAVRQLMAIAFAGQETAAPAMETTSSKMTSVARSVETDVLRTTVAASMP